MPNQSVRRQQVFQPHRIRARNVDDFRAAPCSGYQRYVMTGHAESRSHRGKCGHGSVSVDGALADPDD